MTRTFSRTAALTALTAAGLFGSWTGAHADSSTQADQFERTAMLTKPAVVKVYAGCAATFTNARTRREYPTNNVGSGSGFFLSGDGYLATNAHVVDDYKNPDDCRDGLVANYLSRVAAEGGQDFARMTPPQRQQFAQTTMAQSKLSDFTLIHSIILPNGRAVSYEIKSYGMPINAENLGGKDVAILKAEVRNAPTLKIGNSDALGLQEHVTVVGYPGAADSTKPALLNKPSQLEVSFTDGRVSAKKAGPDGAPVLQVSAPATHGNSGGPVLNDAGEVIGLLTFGGNRLNGQEIQGFNFVVASSTVLEYVRQSGAVSGPSYTDAEYGKGLEFFWASRYHEAIGRFEATKRLFGDHSEADRMISRSQEALARGGGSTPTAPVAPTAPATPVAPVAPKPNPTVAPGAPVDPVAVFTNLSRKAGAPNTGSAAVAAPPAPTVTVSPDGGTPANTNGDDNTALKLFGALTSLGAVFGMGGRFALKLFRQS